MNCRECIAFNFGLGSGCSRGTKKCGYGHGCSDQNTSQDNKYIYDLIKKGQAGNKKAFKDFKLHGDSWSSKNLEVLERLSKKCHRYLTTCMKLQNGEHLSPSDLCSGGINCMAGVCGDSPNFDFSKSFLLDKGDWFNGVPDGIGIRLTEFGLIPFVEQERLLEEQKRDAQVKAMIAEFQNGPTLAEAYGSNGPTLAENKTKFNANKSKNAFSTLAEVDDQEESTSKPKHNWEVTDWQAKSAEADELLLESGEKVLHHNGDVYKYTLQPGQSLSFHNGKPVILSKVNYSTRIATFIALESERQKADMAKQAALIKKIGIPSMSSFLEDDQEDMEDFDDWQEEDSWIEEDDWDDDDWDEED